MKKSVPLLFPVVVTGCIWAFSQQQENDPWEKYRPRKLGEVVKANNSVDMQQQPGVNLVVGSITIKARVIYGGKSRPIPADKRSLIKLWMQSNRYPEEAF